jgi:hypothetical protein
MLPYYSLIDPRGEEVRWDALLANFPDATFFHTGAWAATLIEAYPFKPFYCAWIAPLSSQPIALVPIMETRTLTGKRKGVSLPFSDECQPLVTDPSLWDEILKQLVALGNQRGWRSIEFRGGRQLMGGAAVSAHYIGHRLDLDKEIPELFSSLHDSHQRNIRKAMNERVIVSRDCSREALRIFYRLNCLTRREHGLPPQPWHFFESLYRHILSREKGFVSIGRLVQGKALAANVYLEYGPTVLYKYGSSDRRFQQKRASNLVMWDSLSNCATEKKKTMLFGRTDRDHAGLLRYKKGFGAGEYPISYYRYDISLHSFIGAEAGKKNVGAVIHFFFRRCPLFILRMIGKLFYKYNG